MPLAIIVLIITFVVLLVLNVPVAFSMGLAALLGLVVMGDMPALVSTAQQMATGFDSFALLAIPFFVLSGLFMGHGGIARRLIDFANVLVGGFRGGLAFVNIMTCMLFGSISGSATAAVSSIGGFMIPLMNKRGYHRDFNAAISITAATTGLLIPPSNVMIVYSLASGGVSIAAIFIAGVLPGILVGLSLMVVAGILSARNKYGKEEAYKINEIITRLVGAIICLVLPIALFVIRKNYQIPEEQLKAMLLENAALKGSLADINRIFLIFSLILLAVIIGINLFLKFRAVQPEKKTVVTGLACFLFPFLLLLRGCFTAVKLQAGSLAITNGIIAGYVLMLIIAILIYGLKVSWKGFICFVQAIPALLLIIIVLGGILSGVFTATEASAIAVVYSFLLSVFIYKEVKFNDLSKIILQSAITTAVVMLLIATSMAMSWVLAVENIPQSVSAFLLGLTENKIALLLIINLILLVVGTFMDMTPAVLIFTPIFLPIVTGFGMDPLHFGIILIMNLCIGLCTPPVGTCLFVGCGIAETTVTKVMRHIVPCFIAMIAVLLICTYIPNLSLTLPRLFDLIK